MRITQLNLAYDPSLATPEAILDAYHTLTGWSRAVSRAGSTVNVVQRFSRNARVDDGPVAYEFVAAGTDGTPGPWASFDGVVAAIEKARPDVVHINGLMFPGMVAALRQRLSPRVAIVLQDHSGHVPRGVTALHLWTARRWRRAFGAVDAVTFTAGDLAERWYRVGLPRSTTVLAIPEASTELVPTAVTVSTDADPSILWVGRLTANKDPMTALAALELALPALPHARCAMVFQGGELESAVTRRIRSTPALAGRVILVGRVAHNALPSYYSAADVFLSASHHEGSGYALIESMACGVTPCVTDIPAFRVLAGECGRRWPVGDAQAAAKALIDLAAADRHRARTAVRARFERTLSWDVIGTKTVDAYRALSEQRLRGRSR